MAGKDRGVDTDVSGVKPATSGETSYIGVPDDYTAKRPDGVRATGDRNKGGSPKSTRYGFTELTPQERVVTPRYKTGAQHAPATWSKEERVRLQASLVRAGLLKGSFRLGVWDDESSKAYADVLAYANRAGLSDDEALQDLLSSPLLEDEEKRAPFRARLSNESDLRAVADSIATSVMGMGFSPAEIAKFIAEQHGAERSAQLAEYNAVESGGTYQDSPDPRVAAENFARRLHPTEAGAKDMATLSSEFLQAIQSESTADRVF